MNVFTIFKKKNLTNGHEAEQVNYRKKRSGSDGELLAAGFAGPLLDPVERELRYLFGIPLSALFLQGTLQE